MPNILDNVDEMIALDGKRGLLSIQQVGSQIKQAWEEIANIEFPADYKNVHNIVVAGMGGSAYGTHVIQALFKDELKVPVFSSPDYTLPSWVNEKTLVVLSSYSGNTEETLTAAQDAVAKKAKITGLTTGGKLGEFLKKGGYPAYVFTPTFNPCNTPRYALGYSIFGQMALLAKAGLIPLSQKDFEDVLDVVAQVQVRVSVDVESLKNEAKILAFEILDRIPVITVAEHLEGAGHVVANAFNETAKTYSEYRVIPELNHHLMEGLAFPKSNDRTLVYLLVQSSLYGNSNKKRVKLTEEVVSRNSIEVKALRLTAKTKIAQVFELMVLGAYTTYYLAMLNHQDPVPNPWVDWFKDELKK